MQWLKRSFIPRDGNAATETEQEQAVQTFHRFPDLPSELRLQIWGYYFDVSRIHVLYQGLSTSHQNDETPVAYADLTAKTNDNVPAHRRFAAAAMNREALEVFQKTFDFVHMNFLGLPSKQVRKLFHDKLKSLIGPKDFTQPLMIPKEVLRSRPDVAELVRNPGGSPPDTVMPGVHINWEKDLLYLTDGTDVNCEMLRRACNGPIASKLRRVAILIHDSYTYEGWRRFYGPSVDFPSPFAKLSEVILAVSLSDIKPSDHTTIERDEFGFVPYDSIIQGQEKDTWEWAQNMKLIERRFMYVAQVLREAFPDLEDHKIKVRRFQLHDCRSWAHLRMPL